VILQGNPEEAIDVSKLKSGAYVLQVQGNQGILTRMIIVE
jgi:hypothetical protein